VRAGGLIGQFNGFSLQPFFRPPANFPRQPKSQIPGIKKAAGIPPAAFRFGAETPWRRRGGRLVASRAARNGAPDRDDDADAGIAVERERRVFALLGARRT
jgi:hypothetical protein